MQAGFAVIGWPAALHHVGERIDYDAAALGPEHDALRNELVRELDHQIEQAEGPSWPSQPPSV